MMRKFGTVVTMVALFLLTASASAVVTMDEPGMTSALWTFPTSDTPAYPDEYVNENGRPQVDFFGEFADNTVWLAEDYGHTGVWVIDRTAPSDMRIFVPNFGPNDMKKIWVNIVFASQEDKAPNVFVLPEGDDTQPVPRMELVSQTPVDNDYSLASYYLELPFNPTWEYIFIRPRDCQVYIDSVDVKTQCIPEPMTLVLLGLGSVAALRRRVL